MLNVLLGTLPIAIISVRRAITLVHNATHRKTSVIRVLQRQGYRTRHWTASAIKSALKALSRTRQLSLVMFASTHAQHVSTKGNA